VASDDGRVKLVFLYDENDDILLNMMMFLNILLFLMIIIENY